MAAPLAQHVLQAVGDLAFRRQLADGRDATVAQPAMLAVRAGTVEHDVGLIDPLAVLSLPDQEAKRLPAAEGIIGFFLLAHACPAELQYLGFGTQAAAKQARF